MAASRRVALKDVCVKIGSGATPRGGKEAYRGGSTALIRSQNVYNDQFAYDGLAFIDDAQADELSNVVVSEGDVLLNITGDSVARCCRAPRDVIPARVNQHVAIIRPDTGQLDSGFLRYVLVSPEYQHHLLALASAGATRNALTKGMIEALEVPAPSLPEQKRIAHILGTLDDKIELNRRMNATLEAMSRAIFKSWFVDFDPVRQKAAGKQPVGMDAHTAALFPDSFEESEIGEVPKGWRIEKLSTVMTFEGGTQPPASEFVSEPRGGYVRLVQIRDFQSDRHITFVPETPKLRRFSEDDVMLARYGSSGNAEKAEDSLARVCRGLSGAYNVALVKVMPLRDCREFLAVFLKSGEFQQKIKGMGARSVQSGFRKEDLDVIPVISAPSAVHAAFEGLGAAIWRHTLARRREGERLATLRDTLLPKLLSGEIRVPEAEQAVEEALA